MSATSIRIVVPCYEEAERFDSEAFREYLEETTDVRFVLVNDGSPDNTLQVLEDLRDAWPDRIDVIDQQPNQGKAEAVRVGLLYALDKGADYVGYWDADLATPLEVIEEATLVMERYRGIQVLLGARVALLGRKIDRNPMRHYAGRVFATAASLTLRLPVYDTQCGAKLIRVTPKTKDFLAARFLSRWVFDVELLARYLRDDPSGEGLYELPLREWTDIGESKVKFVDFLRSAGEMAQIYRIYSSSRGAKLVRWMLSPFGRYTLAGGTGTASHYATLAALVELLHVPPAQATAVGAAVGAVVNYLLNYLVVFPSGKQHRETAPKFFAVALLGVTLNALMMTGLNEKLGVHYLPSQVLATFAVLVTGFVLNRSWTFNVKDSNDQKTTRDL